MGLPDKRYYRLAELSRLWECSINDILHFIEIRKLTPSFRFKKVECRIIAGNDVDGWKEVEPLKNKDAEVPWCCSGLVSLTPMSALRFWNDNYPIDEEWIGDLQGQAFVFREDQIVPLHSFKVSPADFFITNEEKQRFEAENPNIIASEKQNTEQHPTHAHPCLDITHSFYSEELALAIRAWEYAVASKPTKSNFTVKIDSFLDKQNAGENQRERIKSVCNPFKRGPKPT